MKRGNQFTDVARAVGPAKKQATPAALDGVIDDDRDAGRDGAAALGQAARVRRASDPGSVQSGANRSQGIEAHDPPQRATSDRPAGGLDDLRTGAPRRIPAAVVSHGTLRGVGPGRGHGLAAEPAAGREQRGEEGADARCTKEDCTANQRARIVRRPIPA